MRPEEVLEFNAAAYAQRIAGHPTSHLQQQEVVKTRQLMRAGYQVGAGTASAILTGGLAVVLPLYASRGGYVAEEKLKIIQAELTKRGVKLHEPDDQDEGAAAVGFLAGHIAAEGVGEAVVGDSVPEGALQHVAAQMAAGHIAEQGSAEITDAPPASGTCSRATLPKWCPLSCNNCRTYFDSSLTTYLRKYSTEQTPPNPFLMGRAFYSPSLYK